jgi:hypothetical protein
VSCKAECRGHTVWVSLPQQWTDVSIETVTKDGIRTIDGTVRQYDVIVAATGYDTSRSANFELIGRDGFHFTPKWKLAPRGYVSKV